MLQKGMTKGSLQDVLPLDKHYCCSELSCPAHHLRGPEALSPAMPVAEDSLHSRSLQNRRIEEQEKNTHNQSRGVINQQEKTSFGEDYETRHCLVL